jgi:uncharacterized membrane protein
MTQNSNHKKSTHSTTGQMVAAKVTGLVGSWKFIICQSTIILFWAIANTIGIGDIPKWDPFPFIFLNLALSFQAAYTAPMILMSQNRQGEIDRRHAENDYKINRLAEKEIELIQSEIGEVKKHVEKHSQIRSEIKVIQSQLDSLQDLLKK